jgi:polysaccharide biosynthesis protein PslG
MAPHRNSTSTAAPQPALPAFSRLAARFTLATAATAAGALTIGLGFAGAASAATTARDAAHASTGKQVGLAEPDLITKSANVQASELAAMKAVGITSIRLDADWGGVQYAGRNSFNWGPLDQVVRSVRAARMSVDLIIDGCPAWAAKAGTSGDVSPPPASPAVFATFAAQVAARYAPAGVRMFEIWNEPNSALFWSPKPDPAAYTADLRAAYASIKKVDRSAFVLSGGLAPEANDGININPVSYLQDMYAHGAKGSFDAVSYHPYSYPALPDSYQSWSGWSQMGQTRPSIRSVMTSQGDSRKQVWITEVGAPSSGPYGVGQAAQGADLSQAIANTRNTSWIGGLYLYSWQDHGTSQATSENWFGLVTAAGAHKVAYTAVATALRH